MSAKVVATNAPTNVTAVSVFIWLIIVTRFPMSDATLYFWLAGMRLCVTTIDNMIVTARTVRMIASDSVVEIGK